jgi:hypothetical protein
MGNFAGSFVFKGLDPISVPRFPRPPLGRKRSCAGASTRSSNGRSGPLAPAHNVTQARLEVALECPRAEPARSGSSASTSSGRAFDRLGSRAAGDIDLGGAFLFCITKTIPEPFQFVKDLLAGSAATQREDRASPMAYRSLWIYLFRAPYRDSKMRATGAWRANGHDETYNASSYAAGLNASVCRS